VLNETDFNLVDSTTKGGKWIRFQKHVKQWSFSKSGTYLWTSQR
jgi:hypothetical protein